MQVVSSPDPAESDGDSMMVDETQDYYSSAYSQDYDLDGINSEEKQQERTRS